jgi:hypothetical protein
MTALTQQQILGRDNHFYIATTAAPASDDDFVRMFNEDKIDVDIKADSDSVATKASLFKVAVPGPMSASFKVSTDYIYSDTASNLILGQINTVYPYQIRYEPVTIPVTAPVVVYEGGMLLSAISKTYDNKGVVSPQFTLDSSNGFIDNSALAAGGRALTTGSGS